MKQGRNLQELALEILRQTNAKRDYLVDTETINFIPNENDVRVSVDGIDSDFKINDIAHSQISQYYDIPQKYYNKMRTESPELLSLNVNHWLHKTAEPQRRMLRTLDGSLRAFLSDRYRIIDNAQVAEAVLPIIAQMDGADVKSCEITEDKMYIKVLNPRLTEEVVPGDIVQAGIVITNSEVGLGSINVNPLIYRLVCTNGMIAQDSGIRKYHIGKANDSNYDMSIFRDETIEADNKAFLMKVQDAVSVAAHQVVFSRIVQSMRDATQAKIEPRVVPKVVELTAKHVGITQYESEGVLGHLIAGGDLSLYGLGNAVTRYSQDVDSYDRATELECTGYKIITLAPQIWNAISSEARKEV